MKPIVPISLAFCLGSASPVIGAVVTQSVSQGANVSGWNLASIWDDTLAPSSGNTYVNPAAMVLRTPEASNATFAGESLTIRGILALKSPGNASRSKSANVILDGGTISNYTAGGGFTQTLGGTLQVLSTSTISGGGGSEIRHNQFTALVSGSANLNLNSVTAGSANIFANASNTFSGTWNLQSGILRFTNGGAVGSGLIAMSGGALEIQDNWTGNSLSLTAGSVALADYQWTVQSLTVGSTSLGQGTYDIAALTNIGGVTFSGAAGTITMIPQPSVMMSLFAGAFPLLLRRRR